MYTLMTRFFITLSGTAGDSSDDAGSSSRESIAASLHSASAVQEAELLEIEKMDGIWRQSSCRTSPTPSTQDVQRAKR